MASAGSRRNAVRFELQEDLEMDRLQFSRNIIQKELGFSPQQLDYVFGLPGKKTFEVIFTTYTLFEQCLERYNQKKDNNPRLQKVLLTPLSEREPKSVTVIMYSEKVTTEDICTWLSFHCSVLRSMELRDEDGVRTGARRYYVRLRREGDLGRLHHLPSTIQLGAVRGHVFYAGQPKTCRKCGSLDHFAANCEAIVCRNCKSTDHTTKDCHQPMKCNLCSSSTHTFRSCPQSYANRTRQPPPQPGPLLPEEQSIPEEPDREKTEPHPPTLNQPGPGEQRQPALLTQDRPGATEEGQQGSPISLVDHLESGDEEDTDESTIEPQMRRQLQEAPPAGQPGLTSIARNPTTAEECREMLDLVFADLQTTSSTSTQHFNRVPAEDGPPPFQLSEGPRESTPSRKRPGDRSADSPITSPDTGVWSNPLHTSTAFLDPQSLTAFSMTTQMCSGADGAEQFQRKKKKKKVKTFTMA